MNEAVDKILKQAVAEVVTEEELSKLLSSDTPARVKFGIDPTSEQIHLGHAAPLQKLRDLQDLGHQAILVIGDFTASIGDPAGSNKTRPVLSREEIEDNMAGYLDQAGKIIDLDKTTVVYNSEWLDKLSIGELMNYATKISVNSLIEREDFSKRLSSQNPVYLHELLYPIFQAIDSVHLEIDIEIGGWDQLLNFYSARELQKKLGKKPESIITVKPLIGLDGVRKMSKSLDNFIALEESSSEMFGKVMSIPDKVITNYAEVAAWMTAEEISLLDRRHPREAKADVASAIVERYFSAEEATIARQQFDKTFKDKKTDSADWQVIKFSDEEVTLIQAVAQSLKESSSQSHRLISQNAVRLNGKVKTDPREKIRLNKSTQLQVGKHRFFELRWEK